MNNKSKISVTSLVIMALIAVMFVVGGGNRQSAVAGISDALIFSKANTTTSILVATSSATRVMATSSRQYALIVNDSPYVIYLSLNGDVDAKAYEGIRLNASGGSYEITSENNYTGSIKAISVGGTASTTVTEY